METRRPNVFRPGSARSFGFTLIEVLVVIVIIGVIASVATLSFSLLGRDREAEEESQRFWALLRQAREEAELQGIDIGIYVAASSYEFLRFDPRRRIWVPIQNDILYEPRELPDGLRFRVWLESREIVLQPALPERSFDERREDDEEEAGDEDTKKTGDERPPQIIAMSSGEVVPFELQIERDGDEALWRVVALADNDLRVERHQEGRDWAIIAQTNPPEDSEEDET